MKVMYGENLIVAGSPLLIEKWVRGATDPFPIDAKIVEGDLVIMMNDYPREELCEQICNLQKQYVVNQVNSQRKGTYMLLTYKTLLPKLGEGGCDIVRITKIPVRIGISYQRMEKSLPKSDKLPWGEWDKEYSFLINHKGNTYLRCALSKGKFHAKEESYYENGKKLKPEELTEKITKANKGHTDTVFTLKINNILNLGGNN